MKLGEEFQNFVFQLVKELTPTYDIKSPDKIRGINSKSIREIDVALRFSDKLADHFIMIECRDRSRPCDINYIGQIKTKKEDVLADKVIIISRQGFTSSAKTLGKKFNFDLFSLNEAQNFDWNNLISISEVEVRQPRFEILSMDLILGEEDNVPPFKGIFEKIMNYNEFKIYDANKNLRKDNLIKITEFNMNQNIHLIKKYISDNPIKIPIEFRMRFLLYVKTDDYFRPVTKIRSILKFWIETYKTPLSLSNKRILTDAYTGKTIVRYLELDFEVQKQNISISLVQS